MAFLKLKGALGTAVALSAVLLSPLAVAEPTMAQLEKQLNDRNAALLKMQDHPVKDASLFQAAGRWTMSHLFPGL